MRKGPAVMPGFFYGGNPPTVGRGSSVRQFCRAFFMREKNPAAMPSPFFGETADVRGTLITVRMMAEDMNGGGISGATTYVRGHAGEPVCVPPCLRGCACRIAGDHSPVAAFNLAERRTEQNSGPHMVQYSEHLAWGAELSSSAS